MLSLSITVKVENIFQIRRRTEEKVVCFSPLGASMKELIRFNTSLTVLRNQKPKTQTHVHVCEFSYMEMFSLLCLEVGKSESFGFLRCSGLDCGLAMSVQ